MPQNIFKIIFIYLFGAVFRLFAYTKIIQNDTLIF